MNFWEAEKRWMAKNEEGDVDKEGGRRRRKKS